MATQAAQPELYYPESDGKPMGETDAHIQAIIDTIIALREYYREQGLSDVLIGGNMMMYYEQGNTSRSISPDTFVVFGVPAYSRRTYKFWEEGVPPTIVFEYTSRSTRKEDTTTKVALYADLGIQEYVLFDPLREYLKPSLQGYQLVNGRYEPLPRTISGHLLSPSLGLSMYHEGQRLRFVEPATGRLVQWVHEYADNARKEAVARQQAEIMAREQATARRQEEAARQQAEIMAREQAEARVRAEATARAEVAAREQAEATARAATTAQQQAEAQLAALQAELARLRGES